MERLEYIVEDSILAELLGVQNFSNKESAILELVKNAYDATALSMIIKIEKNHIEIIDDGCGMNMNDIKKNWMHIGKSDKNYQISMNNGEKRVLAGSKGIGRFALARLGKYVDLKSRKNDEKAVQWKTDWNGSELDSFNESSFIGTHINISGLRDKWNENEVNKLAVYLGRTYCDTSMKIKLYYYDTEIVIQKCFEDPKIGVNYLTEINLFYNAKDLELTCDIISDEFKDEAKIYCKKYDIHKCFSTINVLDELRTYDLTKDNNELINILKNLGDFNATFYFGIERILTGDDNRFLYKRKNLEQMFDSGIILYRNSFSISSYEGKKDWLYLGKRSRKSPAAATHPTGSWRVRENQLSGRVNIDKLINKELKDLSNRQGLDENIYYETFIEIILLGISEFERYRQSLIRDINEKNKVKIEKKDTVVNRIIKDFRELKKLNSTEEKKLVNEIEELKKESIEYKRNIETTEKRYKYDVRILNVLATSGLKATAIAHEMKNDRNRLDATYTFVVDALKEYGMWEELNSPDKTQYADMNVPEMLLKNKETGIKIIRFIDVMLEEIEKNQFFANKYNVKEILTHIKSQWEKDYSWININIDIDDNLDYVFSKDVTSVIFDNLILNSIQQNEKSNSLNINIKISERNKMLYVEYCDDGKGLVNKYLNNPMKILEPHESSRENGHGLGMWIVHNTLNMSGGEILDIPIIKGFKILFTIGGKI